MTRHLRRFALLAGCLLLPGAVLAADDSGMTCADCHDIDRTAFEQSVHGGFDCTDCHVDAEPLPHDEDMPPVDCSVCHEDIVAETKASIHGTVEVSNGVHTPRCVTCHGDIHVLLPTSDPSSPVNPKNQARTCGSCHANPEMLNRSGVRAIRPIEAYEQSVHARALAEGEAAASCSSCHTSHSIRPSSDPNSSVNRHNVSTTCGTCHTDIAQQYDRSIHGKALAGGVNDSPTCIDCHGEHRILAPTNPGSPVYATNIPLQTCGRCHGNLRLGAKYGLPTDKVPSYADSYHGLASRSGIQTVANCASCHGVHDILPSSNPESHTNPANLAQTCGQCHPGAGTRFGIGPVHVVATEAEGTIAFWVRAIYLPLIFVVVGGMLVHNLLDFVKKARARRPRPTLPPGSRVQLRMPLGFRIAHMMVMVSFTLLVYTGFALKFPESWWAKPLLLWEEGIGFRGLLHRVMGVVLILATLFHVVHVAVVRDARSRILGMIPKLSDARELGARFAYYVGLRDDPPHAPKLGYIEKSEYLAFMWGTVLMAVTGLLLWFENWTLANLPGWTPELATALHFWEAVLASLAIAVWHFYWVIFDPDVYPMDTTWATGYPPVVRAEERGEIEEVELDSPASRRDRDNAADRRHA